MRTFHVSADFPLNRRMRKDIRRGKLRIVREGEGENGGENGGGIKKAHVWRQIEDMPAQFDEKARTAEEELRVLAGIWREERESFNKEELEAFKSELNREWSIETGLIERAYELDRGTTQILIERGIYESLIPRHNGQDPADVAAMLRDHENVINALFDFVDSDRELSVGYVKELHAEMLRNQETVVGVDQFGNKKRIPLNHGVFKKRPNNPHTSEGKLHEYCPWEQTASEMDRLIEMHKTHSARPPLARAAWLHHRFVQIHPFEDGNGRIARCLATLVFIRAGMFPMVVMNEERDDYLDTLQAADRGDLSPLICALAKWQKRYFVKSLGIAGQVAGDARRDKILAGHAPHGDSIGERVDSLTKFLERKNRRHQIKEAELEEKYKSAQQTAKALHSLASYRLEEYAKQINEKQVSEVEAWSDAAPDASYKDHYYRHQIVGTARALDYYANTEIHRSWTRLVIQVAGERAMLLLFFHGIGRHYRGVIACAACFVVRQQAGENEGENESEWREKEPTPLGDGVFQINYQEEEEQAEKRFSAWLDEIIQAALNQVQQEF